MAQTNKKPVKKKSDSPLVIPSRPGALHEVTPFELFRLSIGSEPYVAMLIGFNLMLIVDKKGQLSTVTVAGTDRLFLSYLTESDGLHIPGSAKDSDKDDACSTDTGVDAYPPLDPEGGMEQVPDGVPYRVTLDMHTYIAINHAGRGRRVALLIRESDGRMMYESVPSPLPSNVIGYAPEHHWDFDRHTYRAWLGIVT